MTMVATEPQTQTQLLRIPENLLVDAKIRVEVEQFLYFEASLLDERRYADWYRLLADDIHYWMPSRMNRLMHEVDKENTTENQLGLFDDNKRSLSWRVEQLLTRKHWAEDPPSRTRHVVTNVRIETSATANEYAVRSNFLVYRNRLETEVDIWVGERQDVLRRCEPMAWQIARRTIILDQNVVLSKNLSILF
jgi:3-phenylpropionate/cinnamic acid dioxygenase small subunit